MIINRVDGFNNNLRNYNVNSSNISRPINHLKNDQVSFRGEMNLHEYQKFYEQNFSIDVSDCFSLKNGDLPKSDIPGLINNFDIHYRGLQNILSVFPTKKICTDFMLAADCYSSIYSLDDNDMTAKLILRDALHTLGSVPTHLQNLDLKNNMVFRFLDLEEKIAGGNTEADVTHEIDKTVKGELDSYTQSLKNEGLYENIDQPNLPAVGVKPSQMSDTQGLKKTMSEAIRRNETLDAAQALVDKNANSEIVEFLKELTPLPAGYYDPKHSVFPNGLHKLVVFELGAAFARIKTKAENLGNIFSSVNQASSDEATKDIFANEAKQEFEVVDNVAQKVKTILENASIKPKVKEIFEAGFKFTQNIK